LAVCSTNTPFIQAYPWSSGFGTKYTAPATLPIGRAVSVAWSNPGTDIAIASTNASPYVSAYPWSSGFGTKYSDPASLPTTSGGSVVFAPVS
jgi:Flp pilus assembly protein TadG